MGVRNTSTVNEVKQFWEENPLWTGESLYPVASREFFEEHRHVVITDCLGGCLGGCFDSRTLPPVNNRNGVLDLGCGIGFWTVELAMRGCNNITAADLTENALKLTGKRCELYGIEADLSQQNAESLTFTDNSFSHVNCQGVIHHTPDTEACLREIARVLKDGGTASISVYYRNVFLWAWPAIRWVGKVLARFGWRLIGRGRENIYAGENANEIVRLFDGADNPLGKCYSRKMFIEMLQPYFHVEETYLHYFPARTFPFRMPKVVIRLLDRHVGFLIYATVTKK